MKNSQLPVVALLFLFLGCDKKEPIPAYLDIQSIEVQGFTDQKITDAWVYANNVFLGAFPLPAKVPVLNSGNVKIDIFAGVKENGDYLTPNIYPIFSSFQATLPLSAGQVTPLQPVVQYDPESTVSFFDDFEGFTNWLVEERDGDPLTRIVTTSDSVYEGNGSAKITLDTAHQVFEVFSLQRENLPITGRPCWLEISYKTDFPFTIGLAGAEAIGQGDEVSYFQTVFPKSEWTKMYINLSQILAVSGFPLYKVAFRATLPLDDNNKPKINSGNMYLDNVRLVFLK